MPIRASPLFVTVTDFVAFDPTFTDPKSTEVALGSKFPEPGFPLDPGADVTPQAVRNNAIAEVIMRRAIRVR